MHACMLRACSYSVLVAKVVKSLSAVLVPVQFIVLKAEFRVATVGAAATPVAKFVKSKSWALVVANLIPFKIEISAVGISRSRISTMSTVSSSIAAPVSIAAAVSVVATVPVATPISVATPVVALLLLWFGKTFLLGFGSIFRMIICEPVEDPSGRAMDGTVQRGQRKSHYIGNPVEGVEASFNSVSHPIFHLFTRHCLAD
ncbi:unnamed protein product [Prunus brigantina]